ncbi:MAG: hypothetical protein HZA95_03655 [Candidatus Vogelbacteria bacterium]|nr:hypothetical protein [Candidatus Vogelbacteria bacterium]
MIHIIHGKDQSKAYKRFCEVSKKIQTDDPTLALYNFSPENFVASSLDELVQAQSLFGGGHLVLGENLLSNTNLSGAILASLENLSLSPHMFVFFEEELNKEILEKIKPHAKVEEFTMAKGWDKDLEKPVYALQDAIGAHDKKTIWVSYQKVLYAGFAEEMIFWKLAKYLKNLLVIQRGGGMSEIGTTSEYYFGKLKAQSSKFKDKELITKLGDLISIWHDSHRGLCDFDLALERWVLGI